jgi:hypothetical protein
MVASGPQRAPGMPASAVATSLPLLQGPIMSMSLHAAVFVANSARTCRRWIALLLLLALGLGVARAQSITLSSPSAGQNFVNQSTITFAGTSTSGVSSCRRVSVAMVIDGAERNCSAVASGVKSYSCTAVLGVGSHTARARQTISDVLCGLGRVFHNESGNISFTITRAAAVSVAINAPAPGSQLGQNTVTASATASTGTLGGPQNGEKLRLALLLDGVQVASAEGNGTTLPVSAPLLLEGGKHTLVAKAQYLDRNNAQLAQADSSSGFTIVPANTSLLVIGHGPSPELNFERGVLRYDGRSGSYIGYFGAACHALDLGYGPDGRLYILDTSSTDDVCVAPYSVRRFDGRTGAFNEIDDEHANYVQYGRELKAPASMTFGPDGSLYIADNASGDANGAIYRYQGPYGADPGELIDTFVTPAESRFRHTARIRFGPDGALYLADIDGNAILRYGGPASAEPGHFIDTFIAAGSGRLRRPGDFLFRADGRLYVASGGKILRYAGPTQAAPGSFLGDFSTLSGNLSNLAMGPRDALFASGTGSDIQRGAFRFDGATGRSEGLFAQVRPGQSAPVGALLFSSIPMPLASLGDFNGDGCVDRRDLDELMAHILGGVTTHPVSDLNGDGIIDAADARKLTALFTRAGGAPCH